MMRFVLTLAALVLGIPILLGAGSPPDHPKAPLFAFERSEAGETQIDVWGAVRAEQRVSRYLYGKFTEHLGWNVYNGLWAQVLKNPGFESWELLGKGQARISHWMDQARLLGHFPELEMKSAPSSGVAPWWAPYGGGELACELDPDAFNSGHCQKLAAMSVEGGAGIQQPVFLPLHREGAYNLSFYAKGDASLQVTVRTREHQIAEGRVSVRGQEWTRHSLTLNVDRDGVAAGTPLLFRIELTQPGAVWLDQVFLFPGDHLEGFDPDVVRMLRDTKLSLLRFPGGNFVSGYHWEDGVGPVDERPTRRNPAWSGFEQNHVGTDEYMTFCRLLGCEPLICVNAGDGSPEEAANWVEYCNGSVKTKYGALRARNGHPEPYNVKLWEVGNELYGKWQIGHCTPEEYARRYAEFYKAMHAVDPTVQFLAIGQNQEWNAPLIANSGAMLRTLAVHELPGGGIPSDAPPREVFEELMAYPSALKTKLDGLAKQMQDAGLNPKLAITEAQILTNKRPLPTNDTLSEALYLAGIINLAIREGDLVELITHSALVNHGGGLRKEREIVYATPVHYASLLYGTQSGVYPVRIRVRSPEYQPRGRFLATTRGERVPLLDAVALASEAGDELTLFVVNRSAEAGLRATISLRDFPAAPEVKTATLSGATYMARNSLETPENVLLVAGAAKLSGGTLSYEFPPHSFVALVFASAP